MLTLLLYNCQCCNTMRCFKTPRWQAPLLFKMFVKTGISLNVTCCGSNGWSGLTFEVQFYVDIFPFCPDVGAMVH